MKSVDHFLVSHSLLFTQFLGGTGFTNDEELKETVTDNNLDGLAVEDCDTAFQKWFKRYDKYSNLFEFIWQLCREVQKLKKNLKYKVWLYIFINLCFI